MSTPFAAESLWLPSFAAVYGFSEDRSKEKAPQRGAGQFDRKHARVVLRSYAQSSYRRLAAIAAPVKKCHPHPSPSHVRVKCQMAASLSICMMTAVTARIVYGVRSLRSTGSHRCGYTANSIHLVARHCHGAQQARRRRAAGWEPIDAELEAFNFTPPGSLRRMKLYDQRARVRTSRFRVRP